MRESDFRRVEQKVSELEDGRKTDPEHSKDSISSELE